jgi:hypothetical protein
VKQDEVERNAADFARFVRALPGCEKAAIGSGTLVGPIQVPGGKFVPADIPFLVGKVTTSLKI